jgi:branched-chain amino acid transport system ATP-binding protein
MLLLEVHNLTKSFGGLLALNNVSFSINEGEVFTIIGANGAGKTTVYNLITGFHKPDSGLVKFMGENIVGLNPSKICKKGITRTFQQIKPFLNSTAFDNVVSGALCRTDNLEASKKEALKIIEWIGLGKKSDSVVRNLNLFERKLVAMARALATKPRLLLVDEGAAGLNLTEIGQFTELIREIRSSGITIVLVEHVMKFVMAISERIIVLNFGSKIAEGSPKEIIGNKSVIEAYLGEDADA